MQNALVLGTFIVNMKFDCVIILKQAFKANENNFIDNISSVENMKKYFWMDALQGYNS